jgi:hypothetical protein
MAEFKAAFEATLVNEGFPGYNIDNNGAQVCAGINRAYWPGWGGWPIIDALKAQGLDRKGINAALRKEPKLRPLVEDFYRRNFWAPSRDGITSQAVANWLFDKSVNMGIQQAVKLLQRAAGVTDDGQFGPGTLAAVNGQDGAALVKACHDQALAFYRMLHAKDPVKYPADMVNRA